MGKRILADAPKILSTVAQPLHAVGKTGTIYVIDLVGFSRLTEDRISSGAKAGTEQVMQLVTELFTELMAELSTFNIEFGGYAGDALIAWQTDGSPTLSKVDLQALVERICSHLWHGLSCRTACADGFFFVGTVDLGDHPRPLVWGAAVAAAFDALAAQARPLSGKQQTSIWQRPAQIQMLAAASVSNRWAIVARAVPPEACGQATLDKVRETIMACREICDAYSAEIDNLVQDDKGLLIIIVLPQGQREDQAVCDDLLSSLTTGRKPLIQASQARATFGLLFRCRPQFSSHAIAITIGTSVNRAAKQLLDPKPGTTRPKAVSRRTDHRHQRELVGRTDETRLLQQALRHSKQTAHVATLTGAAGIGKTALVQTLFADDAPASVHIEVTPGSRFLPFGCAQDLAEACGVPAKEVFEPNGRALVAQTVPHSVIIENWQWCDEDSKRLIRQVQVARSKGLLLITSRQSVSDINAATTIEVRGLDAAQAGQLIERLAPDILDDALKQTVFDVSVGTPFWLVQAALLYAEQSKEHDQLTPLSGLESLLTARAQALSAPAIALWRLHCAWRLPLEFEQARDILAKFGIIISARHLNDLHDLGWLSSDPTGARNGLRPAHDILADWGNADLPVTFERHLHGQIARAISNQDGSPSRIANHWKRAGQKLRAAIWYSRAAQVADRAGAHRLTVTHLAHAETLSRGARRTNQTRALQRLALSATANWGVGKLRRAKQILVEFDQVAKSLPESAQKRMALQRASAIQSEVGQFAGNSNLILSGLYRGWRNRRGAFDAYEIKARRQGFIYYILGLARLPVAGSFERLISRAHELGENRSEALIGCAAGTLHMSRGEWHEADAVLASCHTAIAQTDDRQMLGVVQCLRALCALYQGQAIDSHAWFQRVAETGREQDHHLFNVWGAYGKAEAHLYAGNFDLAGRDALDARRKSVGLGDLQSVCIIEGVLAQIAMKNVDHSAARLHARNAMRLAAKLPPTNFSTLEGIAAAAQVGCSLRAAGINDPEIEAMIKSGRKALKTYAQVFPLARPRNHYVNGLIAQARGDIRRAQHCIAKAKATASKLGMNYEYALADEALSANKETRHGATA